MFQSVENGKLVKINQSLNGIYNRLKTDRLLHYYNLCFYISFHKYRMLIVIGYRYKYLFLFFYAVCLRSV